MPRDEFMYVCQGCGYQSKKWFGRCPSCQQWNTFVEEVSPSRTGNVYNPIRSKPKLINSIKSPSRERIKTDIGEFDRVLGGGIISGALILVGGEPGIGKSTLLLQASSKLSRDNLGPVLYVSSEESEWQLKIRAERLGIDSENLYLLSETNMDFIINHIESLKPRIVVIDSIQTVYRQQIPSTPGSVSQIRECTMYLMHTGKSNNIPIFIVGHVTKEGAIAGPKLLEHIVDTVLYFEGEKFHSYRILRAVKNRYGSTNEIGLFEMVQDGLKEVLSPSSFFLAERPINTPGSVVMAALEGTRSLLVEIQSLVAPSNYGVARREVLGVDYNRVALILAVLERKFGFHLGDWDVFVNVAGGIKINEPAADMAIAVSIVSSFKDVAIDEKTVLIGEVGLAGEVRAVNQIEKRLEESSKLGFTRCILPKPNLPSPNLKLPLKLEGVKHLKDALLHLDLI